MAVMDKQPRKGIRDTRKRKDLFVLFVFFAASWRLRIMITITMTMTMVMTMVGEGG